MTDTSPIPHKVPEFKLLTFPEAIDELARGKKITRQSWESADHGLLAEDGFVSIVRDTKTHRWLISDGDLLAEDWLVVED